MIRLTPLIRSISEGVNEYFGSTYSVERVLVESVVGGTMSSLNGGKFSDGFKRSFILSSLTYTNYLMRQAMIEQSKLNELNVDGKSKGFLGDGKKIGGARRTYDNLGELLPCDAPLGGCQGAPRIQGDVAARIGPITYKPGSFSDMVIESFAGPHDFFRNLTGSYTSLGNSVYTTGVSAFVDDYIKNFAMLVPAAPFAAAGILQTMDPSAVYLNRKK